MIFQEFMNENPWKPPEKLPGKSNERLDQSAMTGKSVTLLALLIIAGFLGNYFTIPLFFGADFLFGSIAVFLALYFYGLGWGMLTAVLVHSYTYFLWGHPYGFLNFTCEALFVGVFLRQGRRSLLVLAGLFWLSVGMPLACLEHGIIMHMGAISTSFVMLKQAINGVFNALIASLAICYLPLGRIFQRSRLSQKTTLRESLFNLLVVMILFPALLLTMLESRHEKERLEAVAVSELCSLSAHVQSHLRSWYQLHLQAVQELAVQAGQSSMTPSAKLQHETEVLKHAFPDFLTIHVEDTKGLSIAFDPRVNEKGESTIGLDFSGRAWFQDVKAKKQPLVSEVFMGQSAVFSPIINVCVPVMRDNRWSGCATGTLDLKKVQEMLRSYRSDKAILTLTDPQSRIIASTAPERKPMQVWDRKKSGIAQALGTLTYLWQPDDKKLPSMSRWQESFYVQETLIVSGLPWKLTAEAAVAPLQSILYAIYVKNLVIMACLTALALLLSLMVSRGLTRPLTELAEVTANLPQKLVGAENLDWPASSAREVDSLISNFKSMAKALNINFLSLQVQSDELTKANRELAQEARERQQVEGALRESEERYRQLVELSPEAIFIRSEGKFAFINPMGVKLFGASGPEQILGRPVLDFIHPAYLEIVRERVRRLAEETEHVPLMEEKYLRVDGSPIDVEVAAARFTYQGKPAAQVILRDISERKKAEEALRKSEEQAKQLAQENSIIAEIGRIISSTLNVEEVYERFTEEVQKIISFDRIVINVTNTEKGIVSNVYTAGKGIGDRKTGSTYPLEGSGNAEMARTNSSLLIQTKDFDEYKDRYPMLLSTFQAGFRSIMNVPLFSKGKIIGGLLLRSLKPGAYTDEDIRLAEKVGNQIAGAIANAQLFTERQQLEERLRRAEKMEALGTLAGGVAHDLNNVLGVLVGYSELLLMEIREGSPLRRHVSNILLSGQRAAAIIQDLLTLARRGVAVSEVVNLNDVISDHFKTPEFEKLKAYHPLVTLRAELDKDLMNIKGSPVHLSKTIMNLLSNAVEAISDHGEVTLLTENRYLDKPVAGYDEIREGDYIVLRVSDNGKGISAQDMGKIFEPFYTKKVMGRSGTGLGLAVVWGTVKDHGGYIDVRSEEGKGSTFTLYFPVTREERAKDQPTIAPESYQGRGESILVVDDVKEQRELAAAMLGRLGYRVNAVSSGEEALVYLRTNRVDLFVLDMIMEPGMDGLETYQRVMEINPKQKAIIVSGYSETDRVKAAQELGAGAYVRKPYILEKMGLAIRRELDRG